MLRISFLLSTLMILVSCGKGSNGSSQSDAASVTLSEISTSAPVPTAALNFDIHVKMFKFNATQEDKILEAAELIKKVVASEEFKNEILNHKYKGKKRFVDNGGLTNAQIYKKILDGSEKLNPGNNNAMDLELELYSERGSTVGYTVTNTLRIWMNSKFFNSHEAWEVTDNMMHEWLHKLGFEHAVESTSSRPYSVPYAIGYLVRKLAKTLQ